MPRPSPQITPAQKRNIANYSRVQAHDEAEDRKRETMLQEWGWSSAKSKAELDSNAKRLAKQIAWKERYGPWIARAVLLPILALAIGLVAVVVAGLWDGEIKELQKYSKLSVTRSDNPIGYWASVMFHSALAGYIGWFAVHVFRAAKLGINMQPGRLMVAQADWQSAASQPMRCADSVDVRLPRMSIEKIANGLCVFVLGGTASLFSWGIVAAVAEGRISAYSRYGNGREYFFGQDPTGFCIAALFHLLFAGAFWYFTYWVWWHRVQENG